MIALVLAAMLTLMPQERPRDAPPIVQLTRSDFAIQPNWAPPPGSQRRSSVVLQVVCRATIAGELTTCVVDTPRGIPASGDINHALRSTRAARIKPELVNRYAADQAYGLGFRYEPAN